MTIPRERQDVSARILIADDSDSTINAVRFALRAMDYELVAAGSGREAMDFLGDSPFDLVLCDVRMPHGSGWDVLRYMQSNSIQTPIILLTAVDHVDTVVDLMQGGAYDVVSKPFMPGELLASVRRGLEFSRLVNERQRLEADSRAYRNGLEQRVDEQARLLSSMLNLTGELNAIGTLDEALDLIARAVERTVGCRQVSLVLLDPENPQRIANASGYDPDSGRMTALGLEEELALAVARSGDLMVVDRKNPLPMLAGQAPDKALAAIPLLRHGDPRKGIFGVLSVANKDVNEFSLEDTRVLKAIADAASAALSNIKSREEVEKGYYDTVKALALALEAKDPYTRGHSQRVTDISVIVAVHMGLDTADVEQIRLAGLLHDVGKIGIPERIILKGGRLTESEYRAIQGHPLIGENMVKHITFLAAARRIIREHHERVDGAGYPDGLQQDQICLGARIMAVADAFDAMRTDRPYRKALGPPEAIGELRSCVGSQFDADCVEAMLKALDELEDGRFEDRWSGS